MKNATTETLWLTSAQVRAWGQSDAHGSLVRSMLCTKAQDMANDNRCTVEILNPTGDRVLATFLAH